MSAGRAPAILSVAVIVMAGGCELQEVTLAQPDDLVVAEIVLQAGTRVQRAWLHRSIGVGADDDRRVPGARVVVSDGQQSLAMEEADPRACLLSDAPDADVRGTCYRWSGNPTGILIQPGRTYSLEITLADGGRMTGTTTAPAAFEMIEPANRPCVIEPDTNLELRWTQSAGAWVYAAEAVLNDIRPALRARGIEIEADPLFLFGLGVSRTDTTIVFPKEFGLFDRFDDDLTEALIALQNGLPPGVNATINVSAADRNYVNWERGGSFNPSGPVRVPSIHGDGTGVFASVFRHAFAVHQVAGDFPRCAPPRS